MDAIAAGGPVFMANGVGGGTYAENTEASNPGDSDGSFGEAPEGALMNFQIGPMYLAENGWRCEGIGTGP